MTRATEAPVILRDATNLELPLELMHSWLEGKVAPGNSAEGQARSHTQPQGGAGQPYPYFPQQVSHDVEG